MAFSTIQGSGGAPDSFVGTSGVDSIVLVNSNGNYLLTAQGDNDNINFQTTADPQYAGVVNNPTLKGGDGVDTFTWATFGGSATFYSGAQINGNAGNDTFTTNAADTFLTSAIRGGKDNDTLNINSALTSSLVNGNKGTDTIIANNALNSSSLYGGEGNDTINLSRQGIPAAVVTNSFISGDKGNDTITTNGAPGSQSFSADGSSILGGEGVDTIDASRFGIATETVFIGGGQDDDTISGSQFASESILGGTGNDTITTQSAASSTVTGGEGSDTLNMNGAVNHRIDYTAIGQGGAAASATSTSNVAGGDVITGFAVGVDDLNFQAASLSGVASSALVGAAGWNMNNAGVYISTSAVNAAATYNDITLRIGNLTGDAGDTGYFAFFTAATTYTVAQVTLGTSKNGNVGLNAGDQVAVLGTVDIGAGAVPPNLIAADISFIG